MECKGKERKVTQGREKQGGRRESKVSNHNWKEERKREENGGLRSKEDQARRRKGYTKG